MRLETEMMGAPAPQLCLTFDVEQDCPPFLNGWRGVEEGLPRLLELLGRWGAPATFFCTGEVARRFPAAIRALVEAGHELGCHGDSHRRFSTMSPDEARRELADALSALRALGPVTSFRAPNLDLPATCLPMLREAGIRLDSSQGRHKRGSYFVEPHEVDGLRRVPATISPLVPRLPRPLRDAFFRRFRPPVVLFFHPWELVDLTREPIRWDCRYRTGEPMVQVIDETIAWFLDRGARALRISELG